MIDLPPGCAIAAVALAVSAASAGEPIVDVDALDVPRLVPIASVPQSLQTLFADADDRPDLVIGNVDGVEVWLGDDTRGFRSVDVETGLLPVIDIAAADVDGDGFVDIVTAHRQGDRVTVLRGDGSGGFTIIESLDVPGGPNGIDLADADDDGFLDLFVAHQVAGRWTWWRGDGVGSFALTETFTTLTLPWDIAADDIDDDGTVDVVVTDHWADFVLGYRGDGAGGFTLRDRWSVAGPLDVELTATSSGSTRNVVVLSRGAAALVSFIAGEDGSYTTGPVTSVMSDPASMWVSAVRPRAGGATGHDLTVVDGPGLTVNLYDLGADGDAAETSSLSFFAPARGAVIAPIGAAPPDDVVVVSESIGSGDDVGWLWLGRREGDVNPLLPLSVPVGLRPDIFVIEDFTGDGDVDLVVAATNDTLLALFDGTGDGGFVSRGEMSAGARPDHLFSRDFDGDGDPDLGILFGPARRLELFRNDAGAFSSWRSHALAHRPNRGDAADVDRDGVIDVVVTFDSVDSVSVLRGRADGAFEVTETFGAESAIWVSLVDVNGDGFEDMVYAQRTGSSVGVRRADGGGGFDPVATFDTEALPTSLRVRDIDGDGWPDVLVSNRGPGSVSVLRGNGDGTFRPQVVTEIAFSDYVDAGDVTGDGVADLVVVNRAANRALIHPGFGDGGFGAAVSYASGPGPVRTRILDLDGDDDLDIFMLLSPFDQTYRAQSLMQTLGAAPEAMILASTATLDGARVLVEWTVPFGHAFLAFRVEGAPASSGPWELLQEVPATSNVTYSVSEFPVPGRYWYRVAGEHAGGVAVGEPLAFSISFTAGRVSPLSPNPFRSGTRVDVDVPADGAHVSIDVFDLAGRRVRELWRGRSPRGRQRFSWDGRTRGGEAAAAGVYWFRVAVGDVDVIRRGVRVSAP